VKLARHPLAIISIFLLLILAGGYWAIRHAAATQAEVLERAIAELEGAPAEQVQPQLSRLVRSQREPELLLARCLCSSQPALLAAAEAELLALFTRWQELPRQQATQRLADLNGRMAANVARMSPAGQRVARQVAQQALLWPTLPGSRQTPELLASCQQVLAELDRHGTPPADRPLRVASDPAGADTQGR
jgi:hypothetical protein